MEKADDSLVGETPGKSTGKLHLLAGTEGRILLLGVAVALVYAIWLCVKFIFDSDQALLLVGLTAMQLMFGRAMGMAFGFGAGFPGRVVVGVCLVLETIVVLVFYPLFVFSCRQLLVFGIFKRFFERIRNSAEQHKDFVRRYGLVGLFAFVWFPFWMTGPIVGCVVGFLLNIRPAFTIAAVLAGTYTAVLGWALLMFTFKVQLAPLGPYAAAVFLAILLLVLIGANALHKAGKKKEQTDTKQQ